MTDSATGSNQRSCDPFGVPLGVHMRNQMLRNIRLGGSLLTGSDVMKRHL
jgi:hypothetical protein